MIPTAPSSSNPAGRTSARCSTAATPRPPPAAWRATGASPSAWRARSTRPGTSPTSAPMGCGTWRSRLIADGDHLATVFTGQFFYDDDEVDSEEFRARARRFGFDETAYLEALARVPVLSHDQVEQTIAFLADLVGMLSESGLNALLRERDRATLVASEQMFRSLAEDMPVLVCVTHADGTIVYISEAAAALAGQGADELVGKDVRGLLDDETATLVTGAESAPEPRAAGRDPRGAPRRTRRLSAMVRMDQPWVLRRRRPPAPHPGRGVGRHRASCGRAGSARERAALPPRARRRQRRRLGLGPGHRHPALELVRLGRLRMVRGHGRDDALGVVAREDPPR